MPAPTLTKAQRAILIRLRDHGLTRADLLGSGVRSLHKRAYIRFVKIPAAIGCVLTKAGRDAIGDSIEP